VPLRIYSLTQLNSTQSIFCYSNCQAAVTVYYLNLNNVIYYRRVVAECMALSCNVCVESAGSRGSVLSSCVWRWNNVWSDGRSTSH